MVVCWLLESGNFWLKNGFLGRGQRAGWGKRLAVVRINKYHVVGHLVLKDASRLLDIPFKHVGEILSS
jgi:hypothetical protein